MMIQSTYKLFVVRKHHFLHICCSLSISLALQIAHDEDTQGESRLVGLLLIVCTQRIVKRTLTGVGAVEIQHCHIPGY